MFTQRSIKCYDKIYSAQNKDYVSEVEYLLNILRSRGIPEKTSLLDVACGTGKHIEYLKSHVVCEGMDISKDFIRIAQERNPETTFYVGDMRSFSTGKQYRIITCMFSSIGYMVKTVDLEKALLNMKRHLTTDGVLLIEPWLSPERWRSGISSMTIVNEENLKLARMNISEREGDIAKFDFHYLVATPEEVEHFTELHRAKLTSVKQMKAAFEECGLQVDYDEKGPTGRGLYIGKNGSN